MPQKRKLSADQIFTGTEMLGPGHVLIIENEKIEAIVPVDEAGGDVEVFNGILCPGFVNAHCHLELSHMKGVIPEQTGLVDFVQQVMSKRAATVEEKDEAMRAADETMYQSGIVAVADICNTPDSIETKSRSKIYWQNFAEISGFVPGGADQRFEQGIRLKEAFKTRLSQFPVLIVPHAPYSVSGDLFSKINADTANAVISIHNAEDAAENELFRNGLGNFLKLYENLGIDVSFFKAPGTNSLRSWLPHFKNNQRIIAVHNVFTDEKDVEFVKNYKGARLDFCLCANANRYINAVLPPVELLMRHEGKIVLGTDSLASNRSLNIFDEIKTIRQYFPAVPLATILRWATFNGAAALGINDRFGSFENGKTPGVVLINDHGSRHL